jgi:hypothetical protein
MDEGWMRCTETKEVEQNKNFWAMKNMMEVAAGKGKGMGKGKGIGMGKGMGMGKGFGSMNGGIASMFPPMNPMASGLFPPSCKFLTRNACATQPLCTWILDETLWRCEETKEIETNKGFWRMHGMMDTMAVKKNPNAFKGVNGGMNSLPGGGMFSSGGMTNGAMNMMPQQNMPSQGSFQPHVVNRENPSRENKEAAKPQKKQAEPILKKEKLKKIAAEPTLQKENYGYNPKYGSNHGTSEGFVNNPSSHASSSSTFAAPTPTNSQQGLSFGSQPMHANGVGSQPMQSFGSQPMQSFGAQPQAPQRPQIHPQFMQCEYLFTQLRCQANLQCSWIVEDFRPVCTETKEVDTNKKFWAFKNMNRGPAIQAASKDINPWQAYMGIGPVMGGSGLGPINMGGSNTQPNMMGPGMMRGDGFASPPMKLQKAGPVDEPSNGPSLTLLGIGAFVIGLLCALIVCYARTCCCGKPPRDVEEVFLGTQGRV